MHKHYDVTAMRQLWEAFAESRVLVACGNCGQPVQHTDDGALDCATGCAATREAAQRDAR